MNNLNLSKKIYLSIFALIVAFVGIFGVFWSQKDSIASVSADEINSNYTFNGSGFIVGATAYYTGIDYPTPNEGYNLTSMFKIKSLKSDSFELEFTITDDGLNKVSAVNNNVVYNEWTYFRIYLPSTDPNVQSKFILHYNITPGFNANIVSMAVDSNKWGGTNNEIMTTTFTFTDTNGRWAWFVVFGNHLAFTEVDGVKYYSSLAYEPRTYYLSPPDFTDNDYYQSGYSNGFSAGEQQGFNSGKQQGYNNGYNVGKNVGFDEGVASANDYSFLGLMGAVVDAPLNMFVQTFDFNILGFNMKDFFLSILTIALIFTIIRLCMGGKS